MDGSVRLGIEQAHLPGDVVDPNKSNTARTRLLRAATTWGVFPLRTWL